MAQLLSPPKSKRACLLAVGCRRKIPRSKVEELRLRVQTHRDKPTKSTRETLLTSTKHNHGKSQFLQDFYLWNLRSDLQQRKKLGLPFFLHPAASTPKSVLPAQSQASWLWPTALPDVLAQWLVGFPFPRATLQHCRHPAPALLTCSPGRALRASNKCRTPNSQLTVLFSPKILEK